MHCMVKANPVLWLTSNSTSSTVTIVSALSCWCALVCVNMSTTCPHSSLLQTMRPDRCRAHAAPVHHFPHLPCITVNFSNARLSRAAQQIKLFLLAQIVVAFFLYVLLLALVAGFCLCLLFTVWRMAELNAIPSSSGKPVLGEWTEYFSMLFWMMHLMHLYCTYFEHQ